MKKIKQATVGVLMALTLFFMGAEAYQGASLGVFVMDNGQLLNVHTLQETVADLLEELGIELEDRDSISAPLNSQIHRGMVVEIERAYPIFIRINGHADLIPFYTLPSKPVVSIVADFSAEQGEYETFIFDPAIARHRPSRWEIIYVETIQWQFRYSYDYLVYERIYEESIFLPEGVEELYQEGQYGTLRHVYHVEYIGGQEVHRIHARNEVVEYPVPEIVHVGVGIPIGTRISACGEVFRYSRMMLVESTAYTLSYSCTGRRPGDPFFGVTASGMMAQVGVIAVDTNVIPFHTRMYVEGYGFAVAGDRGGAIRGYKIDVFFDTMAEALSWGRRHNVRVWILEDY